jgi:hypothetical protein
MGSEIGYNSSIIFRRKTLIFFGYIVKSVLQTINILFFQD